MVTLVFTGFNDRNDLFSQFLRLVCIVHVFNPFAEQGFGICRSAVGCNGFLHYFHDAGTHLLVSEFHTQTEFAEVLEQ